MKVQAIIPAAGSGTRLASNKPKPLVLIKDKPLIVHTLEVFESSPSVTSVIVVAAASLVPEFEQVISQFGLKKISKVVAGGEKRCDSVRAGLNALDEDTNIVCIHDGARPLISSQILEAAIKATVDYPAVIVGVPVKPTIKMADAKKRIVQKTIDRQLLWEAQTPQVFRKEVILKAHAQRQIDDPTDDAVLVEQLGEEVKIVLGEYENIKITTQEDLIIAEAILR